MGTVSSPARSIRRFAGSCTASTILRNCIKQRMSIRFPSGIYHSVSVGGQQQHSCLRKSSFALSVKGGGNGCVERRKTSAWVVWISANLVRLIAVHPDHSVATGTMTSGTSPGVLACKQLRKGGEAGARVEIVK
eukprot:2673713-Rhodomonas_salina.1